MASARFSKEEEARLNKAAKMSGFPKSRIMREGTVDRVNEILGDTVAQRWKHVIGKFESKRPVSAVTARQELTEVLEAKHSRRRKAAG